MDKSHVWSLWGCTAHMVLVAVFLLLGQHLRLEDIRGQQDSILEDSILD